MRIASLVPSATEALFALGLGDDVVAVTHECDFPPEATARPRLTRSVLEPGIGAAQIDSRVRELVGAGRALYELDEPTVAELEPDLIVTQAVCEVCAVSYDDVRAIAGRLPSRPRVLSLDPSRLSAVVADLQTLAEAAAAPGAGRALVAELEARLHRVELEVDGRDRWRVAALEWLDPPYAAGHWVPDMIALAGGLEVMPCGLDAEAAAAEADRHRGELEATGAGRVVAVDAAASFSRPGPRLVDGVELLGHVLHPGAVAAPVGVRFRDLG